MTKIHFIQKLKEGKFKLQKSKRKLALAMTSIAMVAALTGCGGDKVSETQATETVSSNAIVSEEESSKTIEEQLAELQAQLAEQQKMIEDLQSNGTSISTNDTYTQEQWDAFVEECKAALSGKINNENEEGLKAAFIVLNIDYLDENGKQILLDHYSAGQDVESELNKLYSLLSQVREHNTELTSTDDYFSYASIMLDENDRAILSALDDLAKEVITLRQDLTKENKARIQEIFDMVANFSNGTGTIKVTIDGTEKDIAQIHLSHGGIFAAENIAQDISVLSKDIVSQEEREALDEELRSKDTLAKTQEKINTYTGMAAILGNGVDTEMQATIVECYNKGLAIITQELAEMGITASEAQALYTVTNIDYFMDSANSQHAFDVIYEQGFDINATFENAEEAVRKISLYNDSHEEQYDMARLVMVNESDAVSLRAFSQTLQGITSTDKDVVSASAAIVKGYSQFSQDVTVDYQTTDEDGNVIDHSIDKNGLSKGAYQVVNWLTYYSVSNHKTAYGATADSILQLVDGSQTGLNPYEQIVLMVEDYCAENNIVVYNYEVGNQK